MIMTSLALATLIFVGIHLGIAGTRLREAAVARVGEAGFRGLFALVAIASLLWMIRSYAVALVFVEVRVIGGLTGWSPETTVWACVGLALLLGDLVVQAQNMPRGAAAR